MHSTNDSTNLSLDNLLQMEILQELRGLRLQLGVIERLLLSGGEKVELPEPLEERRAPAGEILDRLAEMKAQAVSTSAAPEEPVFKEQRRKRRKRSVITPEMIQTVLDNKKLPAEKRRTRAEMARYLGIAATSIDRILKRDQEKERESGHNANRPLITLPQQVRVIKARKDQ